jgi:ribonuclease HII
MPIAGVDEAGRGALAGPVVAAAVILPATFPIQQVKDSKQLTEAKRESAYTLLYKSEAIIAVGIIDHETIDEINILNATMMAMKKAILTLIETPSRVLIDGNKAPDIPNMVLETIIQGDSKVPAISAASIIAKVYRDHLMKDYDKTYPSFGFKKNKGYGTALHYQALFETGPSPIHRKTFNLTRQGRLF